jgi:hypothetical protein
MQASEIQRADEPSTSVAEFEGAMRDVVHRDVAFWRRRAETVEHTPETLTNLIQRVSGCSVGEIDRVIAELQTMRDLLHREGERVRRDIVGYAGLSQSAMLSMKIISEGLQRWKPGPESMQEAS